MHPFASAVLLLNKRLQRSPLRRRPSAHKRRSSSFYRVSERLPHIRQPCLSRRVSATALLIGIPSFRRPDGLRRLLASLALLEHAEIELHVFVAESDPVGREAEHVCSQSQSSYPWPLSCSVVPDCGISAARNAILNEARASRVDFVAMLDDDETVSRSWLCELLKMHRATAADVVGGLVDYEFVTTASTGVQACGYFTPYRMPAGAVPLLHSTTATLFACASLKRIGWPKFDSRFGRSGGEDADFMMRLRAHGLRFAWAPEAIVIERVPASRTSTKAIVGRAFRVGSAGMRIFKFNNHHRGAWLELTKAVLMLVGAPLLAPVLLYPSRRLWLLAKWAAAAGRIAGLFGPSPAYYGASQSRPLAPPR